ncbi:MAG TPA: hypothetical protein VH934_12030 [Xanthobacteraceae bacterium]|jgi:hypothetical protein
MGDGGTGVAPYKFDAQLGRKLRARFGTPERRIARPAPTPGANRGRARMPTGTAMRLTQNWSGAFRARGCRNKPLRQLWFQ